MVAIPGASTAALTAPAGRWQKAPTHSSVRNPLTGKWMGVLPSAGGFRLYEDLETSTTGAVLNAAQDVRPTIAPLPDGSGFTIVWASPTASTFDTYAFADLTTPVESGTVPLTAANHDQSPMCAVYDTLGQLWVARAETGVVLHARRAGGAWTPAVQWGTFGGGQTGLIVMHQVGSLMWGFSSGNDGGGVSSKTIAISAPDIAQANWTSETANIPALPAGTTSDDHLGLAMDSDGTGYVVAKVTNGGTDTLLIYVLRRTPAGVFTRYTVETGPDDDGGATPGYSRPNAVLANDRLYVLYGSIYAPNDLSIRSAALDDMVFGPRSSLLTGPDFSDGAVLPWSEDVAPPHLPVLANDRGTNAVHLEWLQVATTAIPSYQGYTPVTQAHLGTADATKAYLGSTLVRQGG